jgi:hypothetical protein
MSNRGEGIGVLDVGKYEKSAVGALFSSVYLSI